ncbi:helix-turn-helix domain-containing protein [Streptomyces sp. CBMA123]|uniref:helix-turn-helix domain-containing protein n=1 Tax=Streptomyces sp. CBMA123 TaxID=1896313 RepID=UPI001661BE20|nr:helix-turn-helix domain-containing protein [Streptomyces sp. CBMA123]
MEGQASSGEDRNKATTEAGRKYASALRAAFDRCVKAGGVTQDQLARAVGYAPATVSRYLSGQRTAPEQFLDGFLNFLKAHDAPVDDKRRDDLRDLRRAAQAAGSASEQVLVLQEFLDQARSRVQDLKSLLRDERAEHAEERRAAAADLQTRITAHQAEAERLYRLLERERTERANERHAAAAETQALTAGIERSEATRTALEKQLAEQRGQLDAAATLVHGLHTDLEHADGRATTAEAQLVTVRRELRTLRRQVERLQAEPAPAGVVPDPEMLATAQARVHSSQQRHAGAGRQTTRPVPPRGRARGGPGPFRKPRRPSVSDTPQRMGRAAETVMGVLAATAIAAQLGTYRWVASHWDSTHSLPAHVGHTAFAIFLLGTSMAPFLVLMTEAALAPLTWKDKEWDLFGSYYFIQKPDSASAGERLRLWLTLFVTRSFSRGPTPSRVFNSIKAAGAAAVPTGVLWGELSRNAGQLITRFTSLAPLIILGIAVLALLRRIAASIRGR